MKVLVLGAWVEEKEKFWLKAKVRELNQTQMPIVIAVDGAVAFCQWIGLVPDVAVGDWDSLTWSRARRNRFLRNSTILSLRKEKNRSDLYHALQAVKNIRDQEEVICLGVTGGRPDQHLASLFELARFQKRNQLQKLVAADQYCIYHFISQANSPYRFSCRKGERFSIFSILGSVKNIKLKGSKYPLNKSENIIRMLRPSSNGMSNCATGSECSISVSEKVVLLIQHGDVALK